MAQTKLVRNISKSVEKIEGGVDNVIQELKAKMSVIKFKLLDYQNQNQMLRKDLLLAKKVLNKEVSPISDDDFTDLINQTNFRGRQEKILFLKDKLNELQKRIKHLEGIKVDEPSTDPIKPSKADRPVEQKKTFQSRQMIHKELQYLLENSCQLKRKVEVWKKRNAELSKEAGLLRVELDGLLEKNKEDKAVHESYHAVDKELRARQTEKLDLRRKLDVEKTRNEQLAKELSTLKNDLSMILSKINDDKVLIDALKNQQGHLIDLLERQKMISENDNRKFQDDLRETQAKHATNNHILEHLNDIILEKNQKCQRMQESLKEKKSEEDKEDRESVITIATESNLSQQYETEPDSMSAEEPVPDAAEGPSENETEIARLNEECEQYKNLLQSQSEELDQLTNTVLSNNDKMEEWMAQLFQTRSLLAERNAEVCDLKDTAKKFQKKTSLEKNETAPNTVEKKITDEIMKMSDVLKEEYHFLLSLWNLLTSNKENSVEVFSLAIEGGRSVFIEAVHELICSQDQIGLDDELSQTENEE